MTPNLQPWCPNYLLNDWSLYKNQINTTTKQKIKQRCTIWKTTQLHTLKKKHNFTLKLQNYKSKMIKISDFESKFDWKQPHNKADRRENKNEDKQVLILSILIIFYFLSREFRSFVMDKVRDSNPYRHKNKKKTDYFKKINTPSVLKWVSLKRPSFWKEGV